MNQTSEPRQSQLEPVALQSPGSLPEYNCVRARRELRFDILDKELRDRWPAVPGITLTVMKLLNRTALETICRGRAWCEWNSKRHLAAHIQSTREELNSAIKFVIEEKLMEISNEDLLRFRVRLVHDWELWKSPLRVSDEDRETLTRSVRDPGDPNQQEMETVVGPKLREPLADARLESVLARFDAPSEVPAAAKSTACPGSSRLSEVPTGRNAQDAARVSEVPTARQAAIAAKEKCLSDFKRIREGEWQDSGAEAAVSEVPTVQRAREAAAAVRSLEKETKAAAALEKEFEKVALSGQWAKWRHEWKQFIDQDPKYADRCLRDVKRRPSKKSPLGLIRVIAMDDGRWLGGDKVGEPLDKNVGWTPPPAGHDRNEGTYNQDCDHVRAESKFRGGCGVD